MRNQTGLTKALYDRKRQQDPGFALEKKKEKDFFFFLSSQPKDAADANLCSRLVKENIFGEQPLLSHSRPALGNLRMT